MTTPANPLTLVHWRRTIAQLYAEVRATSQTDPPLAAATYRRARDRLFVEHEDSPIPLPYRRHWRGASWYPYDPAWRIVATFVPAAVVTTFEIPLAADGMLRCARTGTVHFDVGGAEARLALYWLEGYGGGLWVPFSDATSGVETYGGGRYLYDTIKGADLGIAGSEILLDFNFAYNPSCAYDDRWSCPLSPPENRLAFAVRAGERVPA